ncbi:PDZ and LIM domain protein 2 [Liparis tanakae]|uniref:PDZ and LIM domain protein 2 n=1 Tax=Liparis tanakae TaxID=230148 RepID=A0A4Z2GQ73_9TELE|nr:PDZ and LIM domain protein 2 [Liparis tanakae]
MVSRDENQNYKEYTISSPASLSPGPYSPDPFSTPDRKSERMTPPTNKGVQLRPWSPEEKSQSPGLSRPLSQDFSPSDYMNNSVSSRNSTPPGRYSPHSPVDQDVPMSPRRSSSSSDFTMQKFDRESEVYKMIQENKESRTAPRQSNTFKMLQEVLEADEKEHISGRSKEESHLTLAVRIADDRFRHSECYTCTDCGLNLKMRGHFCVGDLMYCEKHASERLFLALTLHSCHGLEPHPIVPRPDLDDANALEKLHRTGSLRIWKIL